MSTIRRSGQSVTEYAIVFSVVAAAIIGMQLFVKRGLQAKEKAVTNYLTDRTGGVTGGVGTINQTAQYEPYYTAVGKYNTTTANKDTAAEEMTAGGKIARTGIDETTTRKGSATQGVGYTTADKDWQ